LQIIIKGKQMQVSTNLRERIEHKLQRLSRLLDPDARVDVVLTEEQTRSANDRYSVQLTLSGTTHPIHSEARAVNVTTALDMVLAKVSAQLVRHKDRQKSRKHLAARFKVLALSRSGELSPIGEAPATAGSSAEGAVEEEYNQEIWSRVMEIRRLPTKPMSDQEVIAQMEKSGDNFYPFFNAETNSVNVMYKLHGGGYGLLIPAME
jgi:putative sigma-54 modulation protein